MRYALVMWAGILAGCDQPRGQWLPPEPARREASRSQAFSCVGVACTTAAETYRRRFFDGVGGPTEFGTVEQLPPIPPTFDGPLDAGADRTSQSAFASGNADE